MLGSIEADAVERGVRLLQVKTLGVSHPDVGYAHQALLRAVGLSAS